jgi:hypothetical protein
VTAGIGLETAAPVAAAVAMGKGPVGGGHVAEHLVEAPPSVDFPLAASIAHPDGSLEKVTPETS